MSTTLTRPGSRLRRTLAGVMTTALAVSTLAMLPSSAQADPAPVTAPSLSWKVSDWFNEHLSNRTFGGGATSDANGVITFPSGVGTFDSGNGTASIAYSGSVRGGFSNAGSEFYSVTVANPIVTVDQAGEGKITADVSWTVAPSSAAGPTRVTLTTFDATASDWTTSGGLRSLTDTPDWAGILPAGSAAATDAGITNPARPVDGKSFAPELITFLNAGLKAHFYASTSANDSKKAPSAFTAQVPSPSTSVTTTSATPANGLNLSITGGGFTGATTEGDSGIYVGLAPSGQLPDTSTFDLSAFAGANWVPASAIDATTGTFTSTITAPTAKLDASKSYSLYTWRAHRHSTTSQDTETPVAVDFAALGLKITSAATINAVPSVYGKTGTVTVTVPTRGSAAPTGTVTLSGAVSQTAALTNGTAAFAVPATLTAGSPALAASYSGDVNYNASSSSATLVIAKAAVKANDKVTKRPTSKKTGRATITVASTTSGTPTGKITVTFKKSGTSTKKVSKTLSGGKGKITVPKLTKGTWKIYVKYNGSTNFANTAAKYVGTVKVKK